MNTFYFASDFHFDFGGPKSKAENNLQAIRLLKRLENENRLPDPDQQIMFARFTGFGDTEVLRDAQLLDLTDDVSAEELDSLNASTLNAHYTDLDIIRAIWDGMLHLGFGGMDEIKVLDPSAGIGHFLSCLPEELRATTHQAEIELDKLTARILQKLHPDVEGMSKVYAMGFEQAPLMDNWFDIAISNVPFGDYAIIDRTIKDKALRATVHDYFFVRSLRAVKPGGVIAFITSRYTLDKKETKVREYLARRAELLTAIRLPRGAFKKNAGTEVVTDLIILRKRAEELSDEDPLPDWVETMDIEVKMLRDWREDDDEEWVEDATVNRWFAEHPNLMIGDPVLMRGMYSGTELAVIYEGNDIAEQLRLRLIESLPSDLLLKLPTVEDSEEEKLAERETFSDEYAIPISSKATEDAKRQLEKLREMHKAAKQLLIAEVDGVNSGSITILRDLLGRLYEDYIFRYGPIHKPSTIKLLGNSPAAPFLKALEKNFDARRMTAERADIFYAPTLRGGYRTVKIETAQDALLVCLGETGAVDISTIASLAGMDESKVISDLDGLIYLDPESNEWLTAENYLSGNVRQKLNQARAAAELDGQFARNVKALEESLPKALKPSEIKAHLGAMWIPQETVDEFIEFLLPGAVTSARVRTTMLPALGSWHLDTSRGNVWAIPKFENYTKYGTERFSAMELIDCILNSRSAVVYDEVSDGEGGTKRVVNKTETIAAQAKKAAIEAAFEEWIWGDVDRAERMAALYNEKVNVFRRPIYNGSHLKLPGLSWNVPVHPYQLNAVWRAVQSKSVLFSHKVGRGKTRMAVISIMEMIRLGLAKKAMATVPNHMVGDWYAEITGSYPTANVLCARPNDLSKGNRQEFMSRIATGRWDLVIVPQSSFKALPVSPEVEKRFNEDQLFKMRIFLEELKEEGAPWAARKHIEKSIKNFEARLAELAEMKKDSAQTITFDQLGVDLLVVDEVADYKNLFFPTKMSNVAGIPHNKTERAWDMFIKIRHLLDNHGRLIGLTATPVLNTIAEVFVMQEYFQMDELQGMGLDHFDNWAKLFAEEVTSLEMTADGSGFQLVTRLSRFTNLPELSAMFGQFAEILDERNLPINFIKQPKLYKGKPLVIVAPGSEYLKSYISNLAQRIQNIKSGSVSASEDNMLLVTTDGRKAALDINLVDPSAPEPEYSKLEICADNVARIYHATTQWKSTQLIFSDLGTPNSDRRRKHNGSALQNHNGSVVQSHKPKEKKPVEMMAAVSDESTEAEEVKEIFVVEDARSSIKDLDDVEVAAAEEEQSKSAVTVDEVALASLYVRFKNKLIARGVSENEIAFIHDAKNTEQRNALFEAARNGRVRVLMGSTGKMGTGMNAQSRAIALHHLDAPWRPGDITQRDGRIVRQGNRFEEVFIFTYITDSSPDGFVWQKLETKNAGIEQFMTGLLTQRDMEDISEVTLSMAEIKAAASGNPKIIERVALQSEVVRLVHVHASWLDNQQGLRSRVRDTRVEIEGLAKRLAALEQAQKIANENMLGDQFRITIGGTVYTERKSAGEAINDGAIKVRTLALHSRSREERAIGTYRGFRLIIRSYPPAQSTWMAGASHAASEEVLLEFGDPIRLVAHVAESGLGTVQSIDAVLRGIQDLHHKDQEHHDALGAQLLALNDGLTKPWEHEARYIRLQQRLFLIDKALMESGVNITEAGGDIPTIAGITVDAADAQEQEEDLSKLMNSPSNRNSDNIIDVKPIEGHARDSWIENAPEMAAMLQRLAEVHAAFPVEEAVPATRELFAELQASTMNAEGAEDEDSGQMNLFDAVSTATANGLVMQAEETDVETVMQVVSPAKVVGVLPTMTISLLQDESGPLPIEVWLAKYAPANVRAPRRRKIKPVAHGQLALF